MFRRALQAVVVMSVVGAVFFMPSAVAGDCSSFNYSLQDTGYETGVYPAVFTGSTVEGVAVDVVIEGRWVYYKIYPWECLPE
jgi:hypothetical protein